MNDSSLGAEFSLGRFKVGFWGTEWPYRFLLWSLRFLLWSLLESSNSIQLFL